MSKANIDPFPKRMDEASASIALPFNLPKKVAVSKALIWIWFSETVSPSSTLALASTPTKLCAFRLAFAS